MNADATVTAIIVTYNTRELTLRCLESVASEAPQVAVVVVDNASGDGTVDAIREAYPRVEVIANTENRGFAPAVNQGARRAKGRYLLLLNSDAELQSEAVEILRQTMDAAPDIGVTGPYLLNESGERENSLRGEINLRNLFSEYFGLYLLFPRSRRWGDVYKTWLDGNRMVEVEFCKGAALMIRREAFEEEGGMDERFFLYCEEADLCRRLRSRGWRVVYQPEAVVTHVGGASESRYPRRKLIYHNQSLRHYMTKHYGLGAARKAGVIVACGYLLRAVAFGVGGVLRRNAETRRRGRLMLGALWDLRKVGP